MGSGGLHDLVGAAKLSILLLQLGDPAGLAGRHARCPPLVDVARPDSRPHRLGAVAELPGDPVHSALIGAARETGARNRRPGNVPAALIFLVLVRSGPEGVEGV